VTNDLALTEIPGITISVTGIEFHGPIPYEDWWLVGQKATEISNFSSWAIGDWLAYGQATYGEMYAQAMDITGKSYSWLSKLKYVARAIPKDRRWPLPMTVSHHMEVANLTPDEQEAWLAYATENNLTKDELRQAIKHGSTRVLTPLGITIPVRLPDLAWQVIVAWRKGEGLDKAIQELEKFLQRSANDS